MQRFILDIRKKTGYNKLTMKSEVIIRPIGYIRSDFKEKFGIPRQSLRAPSALCELVLLPDFQSEEHFRRLQEFSHLWLIFDFSKTRDKGYTPTVRPPRLGGNERVGVFASRSPYRPNHLGLSCVKLVEIKRVQNQTILTLAGADLLDGTPVFDIKPYLPFTDCIPQAVGGYATEQQTHKLQVHFPHTLLDKIPKEKQAGLMECLADDPRPSYQTDEREYGMHFACFNIRFRVIDGVLEVFDIQ